MTIMAFGRPVHVSDKFTVRTKCSACLDLQVTCNLDQKTPLEEKLQAIALLLAFVRDSLAVLAYYQSLSFVHLFTRLNRPRITA
jgi:hypothetical protein